MAAANNGHTSTVVMMLEKGALRNLTNKNGQTALMKAAESGRAETVAVMLENGVDRHVVNEFGKRAADYATQDVLDVLQVRFKKGLFGFKFELCTILYL